VATVAAEGRLRIVKAELTELVQVTELTVEEIVVALANESRKQISGIAPATAVALQAIALFTVSTEPTSPTPIAAYETHAALVALRVTAVTLAVETKPPQIISL